MKKYHGLLCEEWDNHKIDQRFQNVADNFRTMGPVPTNIKRLNNLDQHITDIISYVEKKSY